MKIALLGNMNNNFFSFTRYLKDKGFDAHLFYEKNIQMNFHPSADTCKKIQDLEYIHEIDVKKYFFGLLKYKDLLKSFDKIIACGMHIGLLARENINIDIVIPYGSDLYEITNPAFYIKNIKSYLLYKYLQPYQIRGFRESKNIILNEEYEIIKKAALKIKIEGLNIGIPMLYNKEEYIDLNNTWDFLKSNDLIIFNHARQMWSDNSFNISKGNDVLIRAFARIVNEEIFNNPLLILFEYGIDVEKSKNLINELNIEKYVKWMPTMHRKNIMYGLKKADLVTNSFVEGIVDIGGCVYEGLASGSLVLNNMEALPSEHKFYNSPIIDARTEKDIFNILCDYKVNKHKYSGIKKYSSKWFDENLGEGLVDNYIGLLSKNENNTMRYSS